MRRMGRSEFLEIDTGEALFCVLSNFNTLCIKEYQTGIKNDLKGSFGLDNGMRTEVDHG